MEKKFDWKRYSCKYDKKNSFSRVKAEAKDILENSDRQIIDTSFSVPRWQFFRIKNICQVLSWEGFSFSYQDVASSCLKIMLKNGNRKECRIASAKRKNPSKCPSRKISVLWSPREYNLFHQKANHLKLCVSHLIHIALLLYLHKIVNILLNSSMKRKADLLYHLERDYGNYCHFTLYSTGQSLLFIEKGEFVRILSPPKAYS